MTICGVEIPAEITVTNDPDREVWHLKRNDGGWLRACTLPHSTDRSRVRFALDALMRPREQGEPSQ